MTEQRQPMCDVVNTPFDRNVVWLSSDDERLGWSIDLPFGKGCHE